VESNEKPAGIYATEISNAFNISLGMGDSDESPVRGDLSRRLATLKHRHYGYLGFLTVASL